jgi:type 1 glutamine amidotransferase
MNRTLPHRPRRLVAILLAAIAWRACFLFPASAADKAADKLQPLGVCLVSGCLEYKSEQSLVAFQKYLEARYPAKCTRAFWQPDKPKDLPGLENLNSSDVMLLFTKRLNLSDERLELLKNYCRAGKPIVGVRTASHAVQNWLQFDHEFLGGDYQGHFDAGPLTDVKLVEGAKNHPVLAGFQPYRSVASLYKNPHLAADIEVLLTGSIPDHTEPIAWVRERAGSRVFYTSLGHPEDFTQESFRRLLANALFWTARRTPSGK